MQTIFHSSAVTGCTDSLEYFTSAMSANRLSALMAAIVTGVFRGLSAFKSTQTNLPVLSLGSGYASLMISAMPTMSLPSLEFHEILPRGEIAHPGPGLALGAFGDLLIP